MGLADARKQISEERARRAGHRLFEFVKQNRATDIKKPMQIGDTFRASSLPYLCVREEILANRYDVIRVKHQPVGLQITFDIGNLFHNLYRDFYFGPMGEWAGAWKCLRCDWDTDKAGLSSPPTFKAKLTSPGKLAKMPEVCGGCGAPFILPPNEDDNMQLYGTFKEWYIEDRNIGLHGHPDGWSLRHGSSRVLVDLKSHGANRFSSRRTLREGHDLQIWAYQHMCGDDSAEVWYMNKSPWGDSLSFLRDIAPKFDRKKFEMFVVKPLEKLMNGLAGGALPERDCISLDCPRAKECQLVDVCFEQ